MARKRYLSTNTANDRRLAELAARGGPWALVLYTWSIPHANDDATLHGDPEELLSQVMPLMAMRGLVSVTDVEKFVSAAVELRLLQQVEGGLRFPPRTFYGYQNYITQDRRGLADYQPPLDPAQNPANPRRSAQKPADLQIAPDPAQNPASFKSSSSSSFNHSAGGSVQRARARARGQLDEKKTDEEDARPPPTDTQVCYDCLQTIDSLDYKTQHADGCEYFGLYPFEMRAHRGIVNQRKKKAPVATTS